jgi:tungstate transport system ATP-binding protein
MPELDGAPAAVALDARAPAAPSQRVMPLLGSGLRLERRGRPILDGVNVRFAPHGISALLGPNGAGKSVLLRVLAALIAPDAGVVTWAGRTPRRELRPRLGFVFQKPVLLRRSALANVTYALRAARVPRREHAARARDALAGAGLSELAHTPARLLSGGEQQRLAIARALATEPELVFLDEPTANLDPAASAHIEALIGRMAASGRKVVLVTHDVGQARRLADEVIFLLRGRIEAQANAGNFFAAPGSDAARAFMAGQLVL